MLWHHHIGTRDIGRDNAVRINAVQGISVDIYKDLSVSLEYHVRYNSEPADDRKSTDSTIVFGLTLDIQGGLRKNPNESTQSRKRDTG